MLNWLMVNPAMSNINNPVKMESGMEIITTIAARVPNGKSVMDTNNIAMRKSFENRLSRVATLAD